MPVDIPYTPLANLRHYEESGTNKATVPPNSYTFAKETSLPSSTSQTTDAPFYDDDN